MGDNVDGVRAAFDRLRADFFPDCVAPSLVPTVRAIINRAEALAVAAAAGRDVPAEEMARLDDAVAAAAAERDASRKVAQGWFVAPERMFDA